MKHDRRFFIRTKYNLVRNVVFLVLVVFVICFPVWASGPASLSGTVVDPSGAVVPGANVILHGLDNHGSDKSAEQSATTDNGGSFSFAALPAGHYSLKITASGFKAYELDSIALGVTDALNLDVSMTLASESTTVEVSADSLYVDLSSTQMGETIAANKMASIPLNGRSFTDVLAMQPGVVPASSAQPNAVVMSGCTSTPPSGDLNPGTLSVGGQRETANGFSVNGSLVEEDFSNGTAVVPNLDSIQDLRVLTGDFDAE